MKRILVISGSRADYGLLELPVKKLKEDGSFIVGVMPRWNMSFDISYLGALDDIAQFKPDLMLILGDRYEILAAATAAHLQRIPIAHIGGGDVTEGSYDDAMRDCISRMASIHFVTSTSAMARLSHHGYRNVHLVGNPGVDYIRHAQWKKERPIKEPYVVVSYQAETIDPSQTVANMAEVYEAIEGRKAVVILPNPDLGSEYIREIVKGWPEYQVHDYLPHDEFLNLIYHCEEFIGNSSSMLYEAPELGIKTRMIGKRQKGRTIPMGDGFASERIVKILRYTA